MTSLFSRLQKLNKEGTPARWEVADSEVVSIAREGRRGPDDFIADVGNETDAGVYENAVLIVECRNSLPAVLNLIEAAGQMARLPWPLSADERRDWLTYQQKLREAVAVFVSEEQQG